MARDVHQRAIGAAAARHQGCQGPLAASPQQQAYGPFGLEIGGQLHRYTSPSCCKADLFSGKRTSIWVGAPGSEVALLWSSVTLQPSLHCSLTAFEPDLYGAPND